MATDPEVSPNRAVTPQRFGIASPEWGGLAKLAEEAGEVVTEVTKIIATGGTLQYADGRHLSLLKLSNELGDLLAAAEFVLASNPKWISREYVRSRTANKLALYQGWQRTEAPDV